MKILIVKTFPVEINIKKSTYNHQEIGLARALIEAGHQCDVMCTADNEQSIKTIPVSKGKFITLYCMKAIKVLKNGFFKDVDNIFSQYDILHVCEYNQLFTWHLAKKYHEKMVCYHGPYYSPFNKRYNMMAKFFDGLFLNRYKKYDTQFITKSELAAEYLKNKGLCNVKAIGVGIDRQALTTQVNDRLDFVEDIERHTEHKIMYIGRLEPRRNVFFLLELLKELRKSKDISLILVGTGEDDYVKKFFKKVNDMGLRDYIIYRERVEQKYMEQLYACANIFVLPTIYDIYGMVLLEAMYFRQCVFTTLNGGSNMMIRDGENGYVFREFTVKSWSKKILSILEDGKKQKQVSDLAHDTIVDNFTWQKLVPKFIDEYERKLVKAM